MIKSGKKVRGSSRPKFNDDTQSQISMNSNISGMSRKTNVSLIDLGSITSLGSGGSKKLPGQKSLKQAAERR